MAESDNRPVRRSREVWERVRAGVEVGSRSGRIEARMTAEKSRAAMAQVPVNPAESDRLGAGGVILVAEVRQDGRTATEAPPGGGGRTAFPARSQ